MNIQQVADATPSWVNWTVIVGGPVTSFLAVANPVLQAIAFLVAIVWGGMQAYGWIINKGWRRKS